MWNEACAWAVVPLPHEKLIAWQRADDLFIELHRVATCLLVRFLNIAEASLAEAGYCLHAARRLGYFCDDEHDRLMEKMRMLGGPVAGLRRSLS